VGVPTSCDASARMQLDQQGLPTAGTVNQRSSYYTLAITAGGKSTTTTFTLGVSEFKVLVITIK
ncbi:MAG: choice-of-anchor domain, partial [Humibacillus sp.]|nr:choice-of-anchor domain [Humibacillus sp.]